MEALKCGCCRVRSMWRNFPACEGAVLVFMVYSFTRVPAVVGMKVEVLPIRQTPVSASARKRRQAPRDPGPSRGEEYLDAYRRANFDLSTMNSTPTIASIGLFGRPARPREDGRRDILSHRMDF